MSLFASFYLQKKNNGKALLVEPGYKTKYPSLALLKFSTYFKNNGYNVEYVKGEKLKEGCFDEIIITTLFTFDWKITIDTICHYVNNFPDSRITIGGIYASLMPYHIYKKTGIMPYIGCIEKIDEIAPDYNLLPKPYYKETSRLFTSRGCPRRCKFCGTKLFEPKKRLINNWRKHFLPGGKYTIIHDNNILAHGDDHFFNVINFLKEGRMKFIFDNGFDCRLFKRVHAKALKRTPIMELRFSFDTMEQDGYIQSAITNCIQSGIPPTKIKVFVLYNYKDNIADALYRIREIYKLKAKSWAMRYKPLDWLYPNIVYISENWEEDDLFYFNSYVNRYNIMKKFTYDEWKERKSLEKEMNLKSRKWNIENIINNGLEKAKKNRDKESLFDNPSFIMSIIKGRDFL